MNAREILGWNLRELRVARDLSQERLALASRIDRAYVGRVERGRENVTLATIEAFATVLGVPVARLFQEPAANALMPPALPPGRRAKASGTTSPAAIDDS